MGRNKDGNTPSRGLGRRGEVSPESERVSVSERASTSNGEFCLLTDGRTTEAEGERREGAAWRKRRCCLAPFDMAAWEREEGREREGGKEA